ncbi:MAG: rRNA maturation RNase YbeY [Acidimicrobiales bacterium]
MTGPDPTPGTGVTVTVDDRTDDGLDDPDHWAAVASATLVAEGVTGGHLDLLFVDRDAMAELNATHMGADGPTDVLAFPLDGPDIVTPPGSGPAGSDRGPVTISVHLGDVVVCPEVARSQAPEHAGTETAELTLLIVHGVLHILGHDHAEADERAEMQRRERHHLARYGIGHPVPS